MLVARRVIFWGGGWQAFDLERSTQGVDHAQHVFNPQSGLSSFKVDDEAHTNPGRQG
jgi:hypothetical protein